ncbi:MAG: MarC family protein [Nitrososphaerota archaeon]|nr:MarC family protein [Candidatus Calditenuaceae archaeon]MDW8072941.1 MarC family protein [Nitrososphaerota archaeon]
MIEELLRSTIVLFVIVDPVGNVPILVELTRGLPRDSRKRVFNLATLVGSSLLLLFAFAGHQILLLFGVSLYSFKVAGGILFLFLALQILIYGGEKLLVKAGDVGVFPIGFPLLVGPGAITTTMITINSSGQLVAILSVLIVMFFSWLILMGVDRLYNFLGKVGADVVARVMAVILAGIAIEYILSGVRDALTA